MAPLRFRAWHDGKMCDIDWLVLTGSEPAAMLRGIDEPVRCPILQSTGLTDKNGVEIFEGDIVRFRMIGEDYEVSVVKWSRNITGFDPFNDYSEHCCFWTVDIDTVEVIGNIHQNPDLLPKAA